MTFDEVRQKIETKVAYASGFNARVLFDFDDAGKIYVDATQSPPVIKTEEDEADVTLLTSLDTFAAILEGKKDPNIAFMMGQLKIRGSMGLALKLNGLLES